MAVPDDGGKTRAVSVYVTFPDFMTAEAIGRAEVEAGRCACVNLIPGMRSIYRWEGAVETADEVVALFKTTADAAGALTASIEHAHPYDTPAIVILPIAGGSTRYLDWIAEEARGAATAPRVAGEGSES